MIFITYRRMMRASNKMYWRMMADINKLPEGTLEEKKKKLHELYSEHIIHILATFTPFLIIFFICALVVYLFGLFAGVISSVGVVVWMIVDFVLQHKKEGVNLSWDDVAAYVVCPVLTRIYGERVEPGALIYYGDFTEGEGLYYYLPYRLDSKIQQDNIMGGLAKSYADYLRISGSKVRSRIIVKPDFVCLK